jgi:hypothetical protein
LLTDLGRRRETGPRRLLNTFRATGTCADFVYVRYRTHRVRRAEVSWRYPGRVVPIREHVPDNRLFVSDDLKVMGDALTAAVAKLGLKDRKDPMVELVARRIIRAAMDGERSVIKLTETGAGGRE